MACSDNSVFPIHQPIPLIL